MAVVGSRIGKTLRNTYFAWGGRGSVVGMIIVVPTPPPKKLK